MSIGGEVERLVEIMARLRAPGGCPWDREQDLRSLRPYLVEECYEVLEEMDRVGAGGPWAPLCEELGDLLFQIVFHAQLASEQGAFDLGGVSRAISDKITSRHPHVFGEQQVEGSTQVLANWAKLKAEERKRKTGSEGSVLDGVPRGAPALLRAERLSEKASRIGFDWPDLAGVRAKLDEELAELDEAIASGDRDHKEHELGDVLFSLANLARFIGTPAEDALRQANLPLHLALPAPGAGAARRGHRLRWREPGAHGGGVAGRQGGGGANSLRRARPHDRDRGPAGADRPLARQAEGLLGSGRAPPRLAGPGDRPRRGPLFGWRPDGALHRGPGEHGARAHPDRPLAGERGGGPPAGRRGGAIRRRCLAVP